MHNGIKTELHSHRLKSLKRLMQSKLAENGRRISVCFLDKTGKVREFKARVKRSTYATTEKMVQGMASDKNHQPIHPLVIQQAVMKRNKIDKAAAKKFIIHIIPRLKKQFDKKALTKHMSPKAAHRSKTKRIKSILGTYIL